MLSIKSITSYNINNTPLFSSDLSKKIHGYKKYINNNLNKDFNENELVIVSIHNLYGYRTGILGYLSSLLSYKLSQYSNPTCIQTVLKNLFNCEIKSNDYEIVSFIISFISRKIPLINIGNWDLKKNLFKNIFNYEQTNLSLPSIFNLRSIYLLNPVFDSGCCLYSNIKPLEYGFERWNIVENASFSEKLYNKGINWSFFQSKNKKSGIAILNLSVIDNLPDWLNILQFKQIIKLKEKLENKYALNVIYEKYETYIIGNFNINFNKKDELLCVKEQWDIFEQCGLKIFYANEIDNNFILYNNYIFDNILFDDKINTYDNILFYKSKFSKVLCEIKNIYKINDQIINIKDIEIHDDYFKKNVSSSSSPYRSPLSEGEWHMI
jgi:hypothetical protein